MSRLRPFQAAIEAQVYTMWQNWRESQLPKRNVLVVSPTGSGKTVMMGNMARNYAGATAAIAHRAELVGQISTALAREGVRHRIIGPASLRKDCVSLHMDALGHSTHDAGARVAVCGIDSLVKKETSHDSWFRNVGQGLQDEAHHVQEGNKWARGFEMFPTAWWCGYTAETQRADGGGLGRGSGGLFDGLVIGPTPRDLINAGYLTDYRIFAPPSDVDYSEVNVTASGDLSLAKLRYAVHKSDTIVGDVVKHYLRIAPGKLGITFAVDVQSAAEIARAYRAAGVPAEVVSAETPPLLRANLFRKFTNRQILQLVNVDLFGEGTDVPALEVVTMVRKTESFSLYKQQFGRVLRVMALGPEIAALWDSYTPEQRRAHIAASAKPSGIVIDHVGNVIRHGLPDAPRPWTLEKRERRSNGNTGAIPLRACLAPLCGRVYERYRLSCPYCGMVPEPPGRSTPDMVDGDLHELDAEVLAALRGEVERLDAPPAIWGNMNPLHANGMLANHAKRKEAQGELRQTMQLWAGWQQQKGLQLRECFKAFFLVYGINVASAEALAPAKAQELTARIKDDLGKHGVIAA